MSCFSLCLLLTTHFGHSATVLQRYPHDKQAFTQGLTLDGRGYVLESTGLYGRSELRRVDLDTGTVIQARQLPSDCFGEGIVVWGSTVVQLTWRERRGFVYDLDTFDVLRTFEFSTSNGEGWGITHDGTELIVSDGSHWLHFWSPITFKEMRRIEVLDMEGRPVPLLNELEFVRGEILANVWYRDEILRIDPATGLVLGRLDFARLPYARDPVHRGNDVFNGIALLHEGSVDEQLLLTGKLWSEMFRVALPSEVGRQSVQEL